jgi:hypothetical protein
LSKDKYFYRREEEMKRKRHVRIEEEWSVVTTSQQPLGATRGWKKQEIILPRAFTLILDFCPSQP